MASAIPLSIKSLCDDNDCESEIEISSDWVQDIVTDVTQKVTGKIVDAQISVQVEAAQGYADKAEAAADRAASTAQTTVEAALINGNYATKTDIQTAIEGITFPETDLTGYATEKYVDDAVAGVDVTEQLKEYALKSEIPTVPTKVSEFENDAGYLTEHQSLEGLATEAYVQGEIEKIDVTGQLGDYALKTYVDEQVASVDVSSQLVDYAKSADVYTKTEIDTKTQALTSDISTNATSITSLSETVGTLQTTVNSIDTSPRLTYNIAYNEILTPINLLVIILKMTNEDYSYGKK